MFYRQQQIIPLTALFEGKRNSLKKLFLINEEKIQNKKSHEFLLFALPPRSNLSVRIRVKTLIKYWIKTEKFELEFLTVHYIL